MCCGRDIAIRTWPTGSSPWPPDRCTLVPDPALQRPVDLPVLRGDNTKLAPRPAGSRRSPSSRPSSDLLDDLPPACAADDPTPMEAP